ncbi:MAG: family 1 glycosylhydrolase, partial [Terracidiphilus sp.]
MDRRAFVLGGMAAAAVAAHSGFGESKEETALPPFAQNFLFGAATSCVQIEGASREDRKGESIWDRFATKPGVIADGSNPSVACDSYHQWPSEVALMKQMGLQSYRFSIAWPRLLPNGSGQVHELGVDP